MEHAEHKSDDSHYHALVLPITPDQSVNASPPDEKYDPRQRTIYSQGLSPTRSHQTSISHVPDKTHDSKARYIPPRARTDRWRPPSPREHHFNYSSRNEVYDSRRFDTALKRSADYKSDLYSPISSPYRGSGDYRDDQRSHDRRSRENHFYDHRSYQIGPHDHRFDERRSHERSFDDHRFLENNCTEDCYLDRRPYESRASQYIDHRPRQVLAESQTMPKHFKQPLTCFYWATLGKCTKSDDACWYAHYETGVVAAAPVNLGGRIKRKFSELADDGNSEGGVPRAVAGHQAEVAISDQAQRDANLKTREAVLTARELDIAENEEAIEKSANNLKESISTVFLALEMIEIASKDARRALDLRRPNFVNIKEEPTTGRWLRGPSHEEVTECSTGKESLTAVSACTFSEIQVLATIERATQAISDLESKVAEVKEHMETHVGTCNDAHAAV